MVNPARQLERVLTPHHALHHQWWCWLLASGGAEGWRRVVMQVYHFMRLANELLHTALQESSRHGAGLVRFRDWARAHAEEEGEHPAWLLEDLLATGCHREALLASRPDEELRALARNQLALIQGSHPTAVLGLYFATECHPPDAEALLRIARQLGLPKKCLRTLLHHSHVDRTHGRDIRRLVDVYGGEPARFRAMAHGALQCVNGWIQLMQRYSAEAMAARPRRRFQAPRRQPARPPRGLAAPE
jgi:predicted secreted protein